MQHRENREERLAQVKCRGEYHDPEDNRSDEEALDIFEQALYLSKGKTNNSLSWWLAKNKSSTTEDILRLGKSFSGSGADMTVLRPVSHFKLSPWDRKLRQDNQRVVRVKDTYLKKFLEEKGLWDEDTEYNLGRMPSDWKTVFVNPFTAHCGTGEARHLQALLDYAKSKNVGNKFHERCSRVFRHWLESIDLWTEARPHDSKEEKDYKLSRKRMFDKEIEWLSQAPESVLTDIAEKDFRDTRNFTQSVANSGAFCSLAEASAIEFCVLSEAFCDTLEHIGLGIYDAGDYYARHSLKYSRKGIKALMKKVNSMGRLFIRLVKAGNSPELARDEVIDQLNDFSRKQMSIEWKFYARVDAPTEYDYQTKKSKPKSKAENFTAEVIEEDGKRYLKVGNTKLRIKDNVNS